MPAILRRRWIGVAGCLLGAVALAACGGKMAAGPSNSPGVDSMESLLREDLPLTGHPAPAFRFDVSTANPAERPVLEFLARAPLEAQVRMDIALHEASIGAGTFGPDGSRQLREGEDLKRHVLNLLAQPHPARADVESVRTGLHECEAIHVAYLAMRPTIKTGSHAWHRAWMSAYEEWIAALSAKAAGDPSPSKVAQPSAH